MIYVHIVTKYYFAKLKTVLQEISYTENIFHHIVKNKTRNQFLTKLDGNSFDTVGICN